MSDLLSAGSLILAVVGMLYSLWYPEIQKALVIEVPKFKEDRVKVYKLVSGILWTRSLPLALLALIVPLIFMPDTLKVLNKIYIQVGIGTFFQDYDSVATAFCVVEFITLAIGLHVLALTLRLVKLRFFKK